MRALLVLLSALCLSASLFVHGQNAGFNCYAQGTCSSCLARGPDCGWCSATASAFDQSTGGGACTSNAEISVGVPGDGWALCPTSLPGYNFIGPGGNCGDANDQGSGTGTDADLTCLLGNNDCTTCLQNPQCGWCSTTAVNGGFGYCFDPVNTDNTTYGYCDDSNPNSGFNLVSPGGQCSTANSQHGLTGVTGITGIIGGTGDGTTAPVGGGDGGLTGGGGTTTAAGGGSNPQDEPSTASEVKASSFIALLLAAIVAMLKM
jgi:hypothetical protein